ncbi:hypothetical protein MCAP1_002214 [Malassezia caprae]|uniref:Uncharacterized protein n=1 Tax=Malassezia caprae TaxID=1381934 RepID=A0AAF0E8W5_9BASI|nr:hypothetical protein MCAP1_002214 [Malassezia caprae]
MSPSTGTRRLHTSGSRVGLSRYVDSIADMSARSSLIMTPKGESETRPTMTRRRSDGPLRSRSNSNMESMARRARRKNASSTKIQASFDEGRPASKQAPNNSESHWESSSDDEAHDDALQLDMHASGSGKDKAGIHRSKRPESLVLNQGLAHVADLGDDALSPRTVPRSAPAPPHSATPRKSAADLRHAYDTYHGSPRSLRSSSSVRSVHSLLAGHTGGGVNGGGTTTPVLPVLTTMPAVGAHHGTHGYTMGPDTSGDQDARQRPQLRSTSSSTSVQPGRIDASWAPAPALPRTWSMQSLQPIEAGGLPSSSSRDQLAHLLAGHARRTSVSLASLLGGTRASERAAKPVVSKFAHAQQQFDTLATQAWVLPSSDEMPGRVVSVDVPPSSVYSASFAEHVVARMARPPPLDEPRSAPDSSAPLPYRYLLDFGLSGPPIDRAALGPAALTPRHGTGLPHADTGADSRDAARDKMLVPDSTTTLGPNMIPFHFIHALTSTMESVLALDPAEVPAMASLLPGAAERLDEGGADGLSDGVASSQGSTSEGPMHWIDHGSMRAIGCTAQAVSMQRLHTVTRRSADPFRCALARVVRLSGTATSAEPRLPRNARVASSMSLRRLPTSAGRVEA